MTGGDEGGQFRYKRNSERERVKILLNSLRRGLSLQLTVSRLASSSHESSREHMIQRSQTTCTLVSRVVKPGLNLCIASHVISKRNERKDICHWGCSGVMGSKRKKIKER